MEGDNKELGCCGYDELSVKPATTTPITFGAKASRSQAKALPEKEMGDRPRVQAKAVDEESNSSVPRGIPVQVGAERLPDANMGFASKIRNVFDQPKGYGNQMNEVRLAGQPVPQPSRNSRPRVAAVAMGQEQAQVPAPTAPPVLPPSSRVEAILKREAPPEGLTKSESADLALALAIALENSALALAEGEQCIGVDDSVLIKARGLRDGMIRFVNNAPDDGRLEIDADDITVIEFVLECSTIYEKTRQAKIARTTAFVAGGLLVGTVVLLLVSQ